MSRVLLRLRGSSVAILSMLPGFIFPFVTSAIIGQAKSDPFFLAISIALVLTNVLSNTIEMHSVVQIGRVIAVGGNPYRTQIRAYRRKIRVFTLVAVGSVGPALIVIYSFKSSPDSLAEFIAVAVLALLVPIIGGEASTRSGQLIAQGRHELAIGLQAMRSIFPLVFVVLVPGTPIVLLASMIVIGELGRLILLSLAIPRPDVRSDGRGSSLESRGLLHQSVSTATMQATPIADRLFLSTAPTGSITSYELADKVFFAGVQFLNLSYIVGRMRHWVGLRRVTRREAVSILRRDLVLLVSASTAASAIGIAFLFFVSLQPIVPSEWSEGLRWAQILLLSLPGTLVSMACSRLLIIADRQRTLLIFASSVTVVTILTDMLAYLFYGAIGIPIASVLVRTVTAALYLLVAWQCLRPVIGSDLVTREIDSGIINAVERA